MNPRLVPIYFEVGRDQDFDIQMDNLHRLFDQDIELLDPLPLGAELPEAEAVVFPQLLGTAYHQVDDFEAIDLPILFITSEFGTMLPWDWEIASYLRSKGIKTIAPYNIDQTRIVIQALRVKRELKDTKFLVFQDDPGEGFQSEIFKRFFWWENESIQGLFEKFGVTLVKKSYKKLAAEAKMIPDAEAEKVIQEREINIGSITPKALNSAIKLYLAFKKELEQDPAIRGMGANCLNESRFSDTTPCLAWSMLYDEQQLIWGCEADTMSMITKYIIHRSLDVPIMMTNIYPFLLGQTALKHERIAEFPQVDSEPENHILVAHCGYLGVVPTSFATEWSLNPKVLAIVDDNATAIDARLPEGPITLAKLGPSMDKWTIMEGELTGYAQYPDSDCLNGGVIKVTDGHGLVTNAYSHHYLVTTGHNKTAIDLVGKVFDLEMEEI
ncbi:MAG: hypothetical protein R3293_07125 [Candidatus Promineifilaceae bacterium]|nr:hypothetical protein [Candidatus Promineifilaceae bacterium]